MSFFPLIVGIFDFVTICKSGKNLGEGCGFFLVIISIPFFQLTEFLGIFISYPLEFIINRYAWHIGLTIAVAILYFIYGIIIGEIIQKFKKS